MDEPLPFRLYAEIGRVVVDYCVSKWPLEACGLVYGRDGLQGWRAIDNTLASESEFAMDSGQLLQAMQEIENLGMSLQAVYHSHTRSGPDPSNVDTAAASHYPSAVQLIVSVRMPRHPDARPIAEMKAYRYRSGRLVPAALQLPGSTRTGGGRRVLSF